MWNYAKNPASDGRKLQDKIQEEMNKMMMVFPPVRSRYMKFA